ncbi:glycine-rich domain-containing protein [Roseovarius tibetensis]|uniref:glycine-rich domain-containing protein n=1 Tax=Roseovarius tibetensis TaxID=2685897 RepID=UPI003D7FF556
MKIVADISTTSPFLGGAVSNRAPVITAATAPVLGPLRDGDSVQDALSQGARDTANYASLDGMIVAVSASVSVNGTAGDLSDSVVFEDVVAVTLTVTDDAGNARVFNAGTRTVAGIAPVVQTAPAITGTVAPGSTVTVIEGTYSGTPVPVTSGVLLLDAVDVTADMIGSDYTIPAGTQGQGLEWSETAGNGVAPDATQAVTVPVVAPSTFPAATGGIVTDIIDPADSHAYRVHTFTEDGTFDVTEGGDVEVLVVGGGGPGGANNGYSGSGGGSGGDVIAAITGLSIGAFPVTVGAGGVPDLNSPVPGDSSAALGLTALGGGFGASRKANLDWVPPTDGGGGMGSVAGNIAEPGEVHPTSFTGGNGFSDDAASPDQRGGGGGRGAAGSGADASATKAGDGGAAVQSSISGVLADYGRGGAGGRRGAGTAAEPNGVTGGTAGLSGVHPGDGGSGAAGGNSSAILGGAGAAGVVIIRYRRPA